jgi:hypothetical protein
LIAIDVAKAGAGFVENGNVLQALIRDGFGKASRAYKDARTAREVLFKGPISRDACRLIGE